MDKRHYWICLIIMLFFLGCAKKPEPVFRIGTNVWPGYECLFLARSLGYYGKAPIKLVEYPSATEVIRAYRNGSIEAAALTLDEVLLLAENNQNPKIVLVMDFSHGGDVIMGIPEIKDLLGLKGRKVGIESGALGAFMLTRSLEGVGLTPDDVDVIPLNVNEHEKAFMEGAVDAVVTFEPVRSKLLEIGAKVLFDSSQIPGEIIDVLVIRGKTKPRNLQTVDTILEGWFLARKYLMENPVDSAKIVAPREGISPEQFLSALEGIRIPDIQENLEFITGDSPQIHNSINNLSRVMTDSNLLNISSAPDLMINSGPIMNLKEKHAE